VGPGSACESSCTSSLFKIRSRYEAHVLAAEEAFEPWGSEVHVAADVGAAVDHDHMHGVIFDQADGAAAAKNRAFRQVDDCRAIATPQRKKTGFPINSPHAQMLPILTACVLRQNLLCRREGSGQLNENLALATKEALSGTGFSPIQAARQAKFSHSLPRCNRGHLWANCI
jgi:hypothetical protein